MSDFNFTVASQGFTFSTLFRSDWDSSIFGFGKYGLSLGLSCWIFDKFKCFSQSRFRSLHVMILIDDEFNWVSFTIFDNLLSMVTVDYWIFFTVDQEEACVNFFEYFLEVDIKRINCHMLLKVFFERLYYHFYHKLRNKWFLCCSLNCYFLKRTEWTIKNQTIHFALLLLQGQHCSYSTHRSSPKNQVIIVQVLFYMLQNSYNIFFFVDSICCYISLRLTTAWKIERDDIVSLF